MRYYVRVGLGLLLGALALAAAWRFDVRWTLAAAGSALLAALGFLATFFVWSADRPDEGYEQVLFDGRNNVHALALCALLVGAGFGVAHVGFGAAEAPADETTPAMDTAHDNLTQLYNDIIAGKVSPAGAANATAKLDAIRATLPNATASPKAALLVRAADALAVALGELRGCAPAGPCNGAVQLAKADALAAQAPLDEYAR